jgi:hypothetical protein
MDKEEERDPYSAALSMPRLGDDPLARRRRGGRMIDRRERPSSKKEATSASTAARFRRRVQVGPIAERSADRARWRAPG